MGKYERGWANSSSSSRDLRFAEKLEKTASCANFSHCFPYGLILPVDLCAGKWTVGVKTMAKVFRATCSIVDFEECIRRRQKG